MSGIAVQGTLIIGPYKTYLGRAEYDVDEGEYYGEVADTKDVITFVGRDMPELFAAFKDSIDDYLDFCKARGEEPEKPYSGKFLVRVTPTLHRTLANIALQSGKSLNQYVADALTTVTESKRITLLNTYEMTVPDFVPWGQAIASKSTSEMTRIEWPESGGLLTTRQTIPQSGVMGMTRLSYG